MGADAVGGLSAGDSVYTASIPDFDGDGVVGFSDFVIFAGRFGRPAPLTLDRLDLPLRAVHAAGDRGANQTVIGESKARRMLLLK
ncbi:MAG: hypothetical protein OXR72_07500 [Gemmatimonadota bacterium]|nr:hypothetical protein [Gemmatimonadota bacterium]